MAFRAAGLPLGVAGVVDGVSLAYALASCRSSRRRANPRPPAQNDRRGACEAVARVTTTEKNVIGVPNLGGRLRPSLCTGVDAHVERVEGTAQPGPPGCRGRPRHGVSLDPQQRPLSPLAAAPPRMAASCAFSPGTRAAFFFGAHPDVPDDYAALNHARGINESGDSFTAAGGFPSSTPARTATGTLPSRARLQARRHRRLYPARGLCSGSALASVIPAASRKESSPDLMQRHVLKFGCCPRVVYVFSSGPRPERLMWGWER